MNMHLRYTQQARWTAQLRRHAYQATRLTNARRALEVGCGTGVLLPELGSVVSDSLWAIDIDSAALRQAATHADRARLACADALRLPFPSGWFDACLCHFFLLWVADPLQALGEMRRVTRRGGAVLALAEPDYSGRIDFPLELARLGEWQTASLRRQGANPQVGSQLLHLLQEAGFKHVQSGVLGGEWPAPPDRQGFELEWQVLRSDLAGNLPESTLDAYQKLDWEAHQCGERILYVPTFYAWGYCP